MLEASQMALNNASLGVVIVSDNRRVIFLNYMAQELVNQGSGLAVRSGVLMATDPLTTVRLSDRIERATRSTMGCRRSATGNAIRVMRNEGSPLMALVVPLPRLEAGPPPHEPAAMLLISDPDRQHKPIGQHLIDWFGLSQAEATLAVQLADGVRLESLAEQRRVRISTLRSQLSAILSKTGTTRQPELIRLLHQLPIAYQRDHGD
jgi:DNA-binding CsgD family transcriptional regulator